MMTTCDKIGIRKSLGIAATTPKMIPSTIETARICSVTTRYGTSVGRNPQINAESNGLPNSKPPPFSLQKMIKIQQYSLHQAIFYLTRLQHPLLLIQ